MYVSHHLEEMFEIGDRVTILRDGKFATTAPMSELDHDGLIALDGRPQDRERCTRTTEPRRSASRGSRSRACSPRARAEPIDLEVRAGEIVGIAGPARLRPHASCCARSSAPTRSTAAHIEVDGERVRARQPAHAPCRPGSAC